MSHRGVYLAVAFLISSKITREGAIRIPPYGKFYIKLVRILIAIFLMNSLNC